MNKISILSNGPSLHETYQPDDSRYVFGVNGVPLRYRCTDWCFCDYDTYRDIRLDYRPRIWIKAAAISLLNSFAPDHYLRFAQETQVMIHEQRFIDLEPPVWNAYSGVAAIGCALSLEPDELHLYGFDMHGDDCADTRKSGSRFDARWKVEHTIFDRLIRNAGVKIVRHGSKV